IGQCPFKWFAARLLRLDPTEEAAADLAADVRGNLYHETLSRVLRGTAEGADPRAEALARLDEAFLEAEAAINLPAYPAWEARRSEHLRILRRVIAAPDFLRA